MNRVFYSLSGEGLGHCSRVYSIIETAQDIEFHVFTWGEAYEYFKKLNYPHLHEIAPIPFGRDSENRISYFWTVFNFLSFIIKAPFSILKILSLARKLKPKLFISDFEPVLPRAAKLGGYKLMSIDNQHRFSRCSSEGMPWSLRLYCILTGFFVETWVPRPNKLVISTFHHDVVKKIDKTVLVNTFLRSQFEKIKPTVGDYVLVYYKKSMNHKILEILQNLGLKVKIYGCPHKGYGFEYHDISYDEFVKDLAGCCAVIGGAGNQLLGEANYYGKPFFAIPEPNQQEQYVNGYFLEKMGRGVCVPNDNLNSDKVVNFLNNFKCKDGTGENGVYKAIEEIRSLLDEKS